MPDVTVHFVRANDERVITVTLDDTMTARDAISELLANEFVQPSPTGYQLSVNLPNSRDNRTTTLRDEQTLAEGGVVNNSKIRVDLALNAGASLEDHR